MHALKQLRDKLKINFKSAAREYKYIQFILKLWNCFTSKFEYNQLDFNVIFESL